MNWWGKSDDGRAVNKAGRFFVLPSLRGYWRYNRRRVRVCQVESVSERRLHAADMTGSHVVPSFVPAAGPFDPARPCSTSVLPMPPCACPWTRPKLPADRAERTPAMAAGLTDPIWSLRDVLLCRVPPSSSPQPMALAAMPLTG